MQEADKTDQQEETSVPRPTSGAAFLLSLSNSKEAPTGQNGKREKKRLRFALSHCTFVPGRFLACVPASGGKPVQLSMTPDGLVHYGGEVFDTIALEAAASVKEAESHAKNLSGTKAAPTEQILQAANYLQWNGTYCYHCRQEEIEGGNFEMNGNGVSQRVECLCCGKSWHDLYTLTGVAEA
jgi:hypothetical protein